MNNSGINKILVVAESIDVEDSSGTKGRVALINNLKNVGFQVTVYHYTRKEIQLEGIPCVAIKEKRKTGLFFLSRMERYIRYILKIQLNKPLEKIFGFSFTLFNDRNSIVAALEKINIEKFDLVMTLSKGGSFRPHHALLKLPHWHPKWLAYIHDPYPMHLYPPPYPWKEPGYKKKEEFMREVFSKATYLAFPSKLLMEWMFKFFKGNKEKGIIIPHQISNGTNREVTFPEYFNPNKFNVLHAGNLLWGRNPMGLIEGFKKFLKKNPRAKENARLVLLGNRNHYTKQLSDLQEKIPQLYVSDGYVSHTAVLTMQENASVNIILEAKSEISPFLPGKFPHCVMANKPILLLGPAVSEVRRLLGEDYNYWSEIDDVEIITEKITLLYKAWETNRNLGLNRPDLKEYLSSKYLEKTLQAIS